MITVNHLMDPAVLGGARAFIFDCDGVLLDSYHGNVFYYNQFKKKLGLPPMTKEEEHYVHVHTVFESLKYILPEDRYEEGLRLREELDYAEVIPHLRREPGLLDVLQWIRGAGIPMAINTSRTDTMPLVMKRLKFEGYFEPVVTSMTLGKAKPDPDTMYYILERLNMGVEDVVFIGDSIVDQRTAENSGVRFWAYKNADLKGEVLIPDWFILKNMLTRAYPCKPF